MAGRSNGNYHLLSDILRIVSEESDQDDISGLVNQPQSMIIPTLWPARNNPFRSVYSPFGEYVFQANTADFGEANFRNVMADEVAISSFSRATNRSEDISHIESSRSPSAESSGRFRRNGILKLRSCRTDPKTHQAQSPQGAYHEVPTTPLSLLGAAKAVSRRVLDIAAKIEERRAEVKDAFGPESYKCFVPSDCIMDPNLGDIRARKAAYVYGISPNYLGDVNIENNRSANIPDHQNCALWIMGLPANVTYKQLLGAIRDVGKIYATVINPPRDGHMTSAAKIVFFDRAGAEKLFYRCLSGDFKVMGKLVDNVRWNKIKSAAYHSPTHSRAIRIIGPPLLMNFEFFNNFFKARFTYELDDCYETQCFKFGMRAHEWHFGSLRCQAASAKTAIERELKGIFDVTWAHDPCSYP